jgi:hypothetical protein
MTVEEAAREKAVQSVGHRFGEFLAWLRTEKGLSLCVKNGYDDYYPVATDPEAWIAEFFKVDRASS